MAGRNIVTRTAYDPDAFAEPIGEYLHEPPRGLMLVGEGAPTGVQVTATVSNNNNNQAAKPTTAPAATVVAPQGYPPPLQQGTVIISLPQENRTSVPEYVHTVTPTSPEMRTFLPDYSGGSINLSSFQTRNPNAPRLVERSPTLPFLPTTYTRAWALGQMSDIEAFIRAWRPKQVPEWAFTSVLGWRPLPYPAPVYVAIPHFGVAMAQYFRIGNWASKPIMYYAVRKLTPLDVAPNPEWVGPVWEVFASWCKPMKWAASRVVLPNAMLPAGSVLIMQDDGVEWQCDFDTFKNSTDPRLIIARNAMMRDYPEMIARLAIKRGQPPPSILREMVKYAAVRNGTQAVVDGNGFVGPRGQIIQRPPRDADNNDNNDNDEEDTSAKPAAAAPETDNSEALIGANLVSLSRGSTPYVSFE